MSAIALIMGCNSPVSAISIDEVMEECTEDAGAVTDDPVINDDLVMYLKETISLKEVKRRYPGKELESEVLQSNGSFNSAIILNNGHGYFSYLDSGDESFPLCVRVARGFFSPSQLEELQVERQKSDDRAVIVESLEGGVQVRLVLEKGNLKEVVYLAKYID